MLKIILFLPFLLYACNANVVDVPLPFAGEKLVLWGRLEAGKPVKIQVMTTFRPLGEIPHVLTVKQAMVYLYRADTLISELTSLDSGAYFVSEHIIQAGGRYRVKVEAHGLPLAESEEVRVPHSIPSFHVSRTIPPENNPSDPFDLVSLRFHPGEELRSAHILVGFAAEFKEGTRSGFFLSKKSEVTSEGGCSSRDYSGIMGFGNPAFLRGACIFSPVNFFISANMNGLPAGFPNSNQVQEIRMLTAAVSKEWFAFNLKDQQQPDGLDHLVLPPQEAFTNIKNGYGIVYGFLGQITEIENKTYTHELLVTK